MSNLKRPRSVVGLSLPARVAARVNRQTAAEAESVTTAATVPGPEQHLAAARRSANTQLMRRVVACPRADVAVTRPGWGTELSVITA